MELSFETVIFLILAGITLGGGVMVVITRNLFHGALYLMASLFGVAGLFALLAAPFLAGVQVVVYIGAIAILIIFAIMLTPQVTHMSTARNSQWTVSLVLAVIFFLTLISVVTPLMDELGVENWNASFTEDNPADVPGDSLTALGKALVDQNAYLLPFEVASLLLMAALIGAVLLVAPTNPLRREAPSANPGTEQTGTGG